MGHNFANHSIHRRWATILGSLACVFGLSGCGVAAPLLGLNINTQCEETAKTAGWNECTRDAASEAYPYAMMASLAYMDPEKTYALPAEWRVRVHHDNDPRGFAYSVFDRFEDDRLVETAVAFRGTEDSTDWWHGNILLRQNRRGRRIVAEVRSGLDDAGHKEVPIRLAGHSLGGAIATHAGRYPARDQATADSFPERIYAFNSSPRDGWGSSDNRRLAINEYGEILAGPRAIFFPLGGTTNTIDCAPGLRLTGDHSITQLTDCLTWIAGYHEDPGDSTRALGDNPWIGRPTTQKDTTPPPGLDAARVTVPVNLHYFGGWPEGNPLIRALHAALTDDPLLRPSKERSAFAVHIFPEASTGGQSDDRLRFTAAWTRNFELVTIEDMACAPDALESCVQTIIDQGRALLAGRAQ